MNNSSERAARDIRLEILQTAYNSLLKEGEAADQPLPSGWLYHYTDGDSLLKILSSGEIFATNALYLNDTSEQHYSFELARSVFDYKLHDTPTNELACMQYRQAHELCSPREWLFQPDQAQMHPYVTCFCEERDLLSQWRGYGATGNGYAIAFDPKELHRLGLSNVSLHRISYGPDDVTTNIHRGTAVIGEAAESACLQGLDQSSGVQTAVELLLKFVAVCASWTKHPSFSVEHEWRLVSQFLGYDAIRPQHDDFRSRRGLIAPYRRIRLWNPDADSPTRLIREIVIGPAVDKQLARFALSKFVAASDALRDVRIIESDVPWLDR